MSHARRRPPPRIAFALAAVPFALSGPDPCYPNEPDGLDVIAETSFEAPFTWGPSVPPEARGRWWQYPAGDRASARRREEGIPGGPAFDRTRFPRGLPPGSAPVSWGAWDEASSQRGRELERLYFSQRLRLVDSGAGTWESQRTGTKLGFFAVGTCSGADNELYLMMDGGSRPAFGVAVYQQGPVSRRLPPNRFAGPVLHVGRWHHVELDMASNQLGRADGHLRMWVDGRLVMDHRDVRFRTREAPCGFAAYKWNPTWGGTGGPRRRHDDFIDVSNIRISGR